MTLYKTLGSPKAFRLLVVHQGKGEDPVRAELQVTQLTQLDANPYPPYETISYCWGDSTNTDTIYLNNKKISVPASSAAAVRCVRLTDRDRIVWIDAICINQADLDERAQQVAMMAEVYAHSNGNLVYLGKEDECTKRAIESIERILADIRKRTNDFRNVTDTPFESLEHRFFFEDVSCNADQRALVSFFSNDWFRRVWAFQEAALAPSNTCYLGQTRIDLLDIVRVAQWIYYQSATYSYELLNSRGIWCAGELHNVIDKALGFHYSTRQLTLAALFDKSMGLLASDPRDHVFGLLGLWTRSRGYRRAELPLALAPNYRKPVEHVFRDATRVALSEMNTFTIWQSLSHRSEEGLLSDIFPSWALRLNQHFDEDHDPTQMLINLFAADKGRCIEHPKIRFDNDDTISARGICVGKVTDVTAAFQPEETSKPANLRAWTNEVVATAKTKRNPDEKAVNYDNIPLALLAGVDVEDGSLASSKDMLDFPAFLRVLNDEHAVIPPYKSCTSATPDSIRAAAKFRRGIFVGSYNRRVFITDMGHIGVGPKLARAGDVVVILYGGRTPYVLRPFGEAHRLVGDCYVAGVMQGEAVGKHDEEGGPDIEFRIQ